MWKVTQMTGTVHKTPNAELTEQATIDKLATENAALAAQNLELLRELRATRRPRSFALALHKLQREIAALIPDSRPANDAPLEQGRKRT